MALIWLKVLDGIAIGALVGCAAWFGAVRRAAFAALPTPRSGHLPIGVEAPARQDPAAAPGGSAVVRTGGPVKPPGHDPDRDGAGGWPPGPAVPQPPPAPPRVGAARRRRSI